MDAVARFSINTTREVFLLGDQQHVAKVEAQTKNFYFLHPKPASALSGFRQDMYFVVAVVDFANTAKLQQVARIYSGLSSAVAHKLIFAVGPDVLTQEHMLFAWELGCRRVFSGFSAMDDYKEYVKRICLDATETGSLTAFEEDIERARIGGNTGALVKIAERLKSLPRESEETARLLAVVYLEVKDHRRAEASLKRVLHFNPQNLWAASTLAKFYLRSGRASLGIEMLKGMGQLHEMNCERMLTLGRALLIAGDNDGAKEEFEKGANLSGGVDRRFDEGLAMVKVANGDHASAAADLSGAELSIEVISFLNLKAILASRQGQYAESIRYYQFALSGLKQRPETQAKLKFNMALSYIKTGDLLTAQTLLKESVEMGGRDFQRARRPLDVVTVALKQKKQLSEDSKREIFNTDTEWETLF